MAAKFFAVVVASLALVNTISACGQSWPCGGPAGPPAWPAWGAGAIGGCGCNTVAVDNGGALGVTSASALAPTGISIVSNNEICGVLDVTGSVPLLAAVGFEGNLPTAGSAGTSYCCGSGNVAITPESLAAAGIGASSGLTGYGLGANAGRLIAPGAGCGCGGIFY